MIANQRTHERSGAALYFSFTGFLIAIILEGVHRADARPDARPADLYLISEYVLVGIGSIGYVAFATFGERLRHRLHVPAWLYDAPVLLWSAAFIWVSYYLVNNEHNRFVILIALLQALFLKRFGMGNTRIGFIALLALCCMTWSLSANITFTPLKDWLMGASPDTAFSAISFAIAFFLVLTALGRGSVAPIRFDARRFGAYAFAAAAIAEAALRTDHLTSDWILYHRSYFADVANLVRSGHWLLWDVPSQYGFLSMLALAVLPGQNAWQSLYVLTAIILGVEALIVFSVLYYGRRGWVDYAFALLLPLATYFCLSVARYPFDGRLYPQGGLRFIWTVLLIFVAFGMYVRRADLRLVRLLRVAGYVIWAVAVLWSFETAIWGTIVWLAHTGSEALIEVLAHGRPTLKRTLNVFSVSFLPFVVIPLTFCAVLELIYHIALGHGPDFISYVEFSSVYAADPNFHVLVDRHGPAWTLLLILGALGTLGVVAARNRYFEALPLIATAWLAAWITASYWVGESFDNHVAATYGVAIPAAAVAIFLSREWFEGSRAATFARLSLAPIAIVLVALLFGEPGRMLKIKAPLVPGWSFDSTREFPTVSGELKALIARAGITPEDRVIFPNSVGWAKTVSGLVVPFVRLPDGSVREYRAWVPLGPEGVYNTIESLALDRRTTYIDRYLDRFRGSAWYVTYREAGGCALISSRLRTVRSVKTSNFTASLCSMR